ncbi:MAG TPA: FHA domain-containing protein [Streptosporangiaceae bacterium]
MLLIVMFESGTWRARPGQVITFGRGKECTINLPSSDRGLSRSAGSLSFRGGAWWLRNDSSSSLLHLSGDRGFRVDLPPGMGIPVRLLGVFDSYTLRLRLPDLDAVPDQDGEPGQPGRAPGEPAATGTGEHQVTSTRYRARLTDSDRLVLAARFEDYLSWRHVGAPAPRSAKDAAERIGWEAHKVAKRCENIRDRFSRLGVPGLRGPRALEELAALLMSTGELTADDLRRLPSQASTAKS